MPLFYEEVNIVLNSFKSFGRYYFSNSMGSQLYDNTKYFSDKEVEGKGLRFHLEKFATHDADSIILKVYLLNIDKNYYEYQEFDETLQ